MSSIKILAYEFKNKTAFKSYLSEQLRKHKPEDKVLDKKLSEILSELFRFRREKVEALKGRPILNWEIEPTTSYKCFAARVSETERIHMSFHTAVDVYCDAIRDGGQNDQ